MDVLILQNHISLFIDLIYSPNILFKTDCILNTCQNWSSGCLMSTEETVWRPSRERCEWNESTVAMRGGGGGVVHIQEQMWKLLSLLLDLKHATIFP